MFFVVVAVVVFVCFLAQSEVTCLKMDVSPSLYVNSKEVIIIANVILFVLDTKVCFLLRLFEKMTGGFNYWIFNGNV